MFQDWKDPTNAANWSADSFVTNPTRREHLDILLSILADLYQPGNTLIDLGFGSGIVEALIFERVPEARIVGVDSSQAMMALAVGRLIRFADRYQAIEHDLTEIEHLQLPQQPYQFVISVQALHHLTPEQMQTAYRWSYNVLLPGGVFILIDRMKVATPGLWAVVRSVWQRQDRVYDAQVAAGEGETFAEHERIVSERGDLPAALEDHIAWMQAVGFEVSVLHAHGNRAMIAAGKPA